MDKQRRKQIDENSTDAEVEFAIEQLTKVRKGLRKLIDYTKAIKEEKKAKNEDK